MARPNPQNRQVVKFFTTGKRAAQGFGVPAFVGSIIGRYGKAKLGAIQTVSEQAPQVAINLVKLSYTIDESYLADRFNAQPTPDAFRLFASNLRFPLSLFNGRWAGHASSGATAEVVRGQSKTYSHAFMAPGRFRGSTINLIYSRLPGKKARATYGRYKGQLREKIINLRGPSSYQMIIGTDGGGYEKWVDLRDPLTIQLRDIFFNDLNAGFTASDG